MAENQNSNMNASHAVFRMTKQRNFLGLALIFSLLTLFLLSYKLVGKTTKVVVVPSNITRTYEIDHTVNRAYLEDMGKDIVWSMLNISKNSTDYSLTNLLKFTSAEANDKIKRYYLRSLAIIKRRSAITNFDIKRIWASEKTLSTYIEGNLFTYMGNKLISTNTQIYRISFKYEANKLLMTNFVQIKAFPSKDNKGITQAINEKDNEKTK